MIVTQYISEARLVSGCDWWRLRYRVLGLFGFLKKTLMRLFGEAWTRMPVLKLKGVLEAE